MVRVSYLASFVVLASVQAHMPEEAVELREEAPESVQEALQVQAVGLDVELHLAGLSG